MKKYQFEVCANSVESCLAAQAGGADRVEYVQVFRKAGRLLLTERYRQHATC